ncbi:MAG: translation initiation inhibitor [Armatimonadetes bacterium]|nr:translation initiation inhibitor [Armatimonadota bacterium]
MVSWSIDCGRLPVEANLACFRGAGGTAEYQVSLTPLDYAAVETQLGWLEQAYQIVLEAAGLTADSAIFRRFFCSDLPNQAAALAACSSADPVDYQHPCAVSWVGQPPIPPAKVCLWAYHLADPVGPLQKTKDGATLTLRRGPLSHHWSTGLAAPAASGSYAQTQAVFAAYETILAERGLTLADHTVRTWLFVQNVDANYAGLVTARRELFSARGMTAETHYLASTGIEGRHAKVPALVAMDAYAVGGLRPEQVEYLQALDHLSPTHLYGVTFERGTAVSYRDRRHLFISGTASIDHQGEILHYGDVGRQLDRALENVAALLAQGGGGLADMGGYIAYVRDTADGPLVRERLRAVVGDAPLVVVTAPVCRPGWLVEVEGLAAVAASRPELPAW